jgi:hypothetical protein
MLTLNTPKQERMLAGLRQVAEELANHPQITKIREDHQKLIAALERQGFFR